MGDQGTANPTGVLALWNDCKTSKESLYEKWYQGEHLHDRVSIPGFKLGRRHQSNDATPKYFTYYETESAEVLFSEAYLHQLDNPSILTREVMQSVFTNVSRTVCSCIHRVGEPRGSHVITARSGRPSKKDDLKTIADHLNNISGCLRYEVWVRYSLNSDPTDNNPRYEEQIRGRDSRIEWCVVAHAVNESTAKLIARKLEKSTYPDPQLGIYEFMCELRHEDLGTRTS